MGSQYASSNKRRRPTGMSGVRGRAGKLAKGVTAGARHVLIAGSGVMSGSAAGRMMPAATS